MWTGKKLLSVPSCAVYGRNSTPGGSTIWVTSLHFSIIYDSILAGEMETKVYYVHLSPPSIFPTYPHNGDNPISYLCLWLALLPQALCVIYVTVTCSVPKDRYRKCRPQVRLSLLASSPFLLSWTPPIRPPNAYIIKLDGHEWRDKLGEGIPIWLGLDKFFLCRERYATDPTSQRSGWHGR